MPRRSPSGGRLVFEAVDKRYAPPPGATDVVVALDAVDLSIGPDESVGIIGPNGAGKSTLLKVSAGVTAPTAGRIRRRGLTSAIVELGVAMHPDLTGRENLGLLASLGGASERDVQVDEIVEFAELADVIDEPVRHYSTGMLARLAFSVATHGDLDLVLIDEVLSVGDLSFQERCRQRLADLRSRGATIVVVSHDMALVQQTCERTVLLRGGRVEMDGETSEVVRHYLGQPPTALRGDLPVRLLSADVEPGELLVASVDVPDAPIGAWLSFEYLAGIDVTLGLTGDESGIVFGSATTDVGAAARTEIGLTTSAVPRGSYALLVSLRAPGGTAVRSASVPFRIGGAPGPSALRLDTTVRVGGRPVGGTAAAETP